MHIQMKFLFPVSNKNINLAIEKMCPWPFCRGEAPLRAFSSFDHSELRRFREIDPHTDVAPLFHAWQDGINDIATDLSACCINLSSRIITRTRCQHIRQSGLPILAYTVNSKRAATRLQRMGVAGVFTDRPDRFV